MVYLLCSIFSGKDVYKRQGYHLVADGEGLISALIAVATTQKFYDEHPDVMSPSSQTRR